MPPRPAFECDHANEVPYLCPCELDCYCRTDGSCRPPVARQPDPPTVVPVGVAGGSSTSGTTTFRVLVSPPSSCSSCKYNGKSRWERLRDAVPYDHHGPCPKCGEQWEPPAPFTVNASNPEEALLRVTALAEGRGEFTPGCVYVCSDPEYVGSMPIRSEIAVQPAAVPEAPSVRWEGLLNFQTDAGLAPDRICGQATRQAMIGSWWINTEGSRVVVTQVENTAIRLMVTAAGHRSEIEMHPDVFFQDFIPTPYEVYPSVASVWRPRRISGSTRDAGSEIAVVQSSGNHVDAGYTDGRELLFSFTLFEFHRNYCSR